MTKPATDPQSGPLLADGFFCAYNADSYDSESGVWRDVSGNRRDLLGTAPEQRPERVADADGID